MEEVEVPVTLDVEILRALLDKETHDKYKDIFKTYMLTPIGWGLLGDISEYYTTHPDPFVDEKQFRIWFRVTRHPLWKTEKHSMYSSIFDTIFSGPIEANPDLIKAASKQRTYSAMKIAIDKGDDDLITTLMADLSELEQVEGPHNKLVTESVEDVITSSIRGGGLSWRLQDLNLAAGNISQGDLIIIGKRPETGGTSFLLSEFTHMVSQLPENKHALIINNEEYKTKVVTRLVSTALNISAPTLYGNPKKYNDEYLKFLGTKRIDVMSDGTISTFEIEKVLKSGNYGLIGINVLEKLDGVSRKLEDYQRLEKLGQWARKIALTYGPVMAVVQADVSAENILFPDQSMLYKTKTGLQGEADLLIMLGKDHAREDIRGLHVAKNKLPGSISTDPKFRHIRNEVAFDIETGRFTSLWK